jgi:DNA-binding MarR family transcriptional regulator
MTEPNPRDDELMDSILNEFMILPRLYRRLLRSDSNEQVFSPRFWVLKLLAKEGPMHMSTMAKRMQVSKQYITAVLDRLVDEGLAVRSQDPEDRRVINISISAAGEGALAEAKIKARGNIKRVLSLLGEDDRRRLNRSLLELNDIISKLEDLQ